MNLEQTKSKSQHIGHLGHTTSSPIGFLNQRKQTFVSQFSPMQNSLLKFVIALSLAAGLPAMATAQDIPKPDARGNYARPDGPTPSNIDWGGALWRCNVKKLNIRDDHSFKSKVVFVLKKGETIAAYYNRFGGSEDDGSNFKDSQGRTWMRVTLDPKKYGEGKTAWVRANSRYLRPVLPKGAVDPAPALAAEKDDEPMEADSDGGNINVNININLNGGSNGGAPATPSGPPPVAGATAAPPAPVVGGIGVQFAPGWNNWTKNGTMYSVNPDNTARIAIVKVTGMSKDGPWDDVQAKMAKHLGPHFPGLSNLTEVNTEHDVVRDGVGLRVVTYTASFNGRDVDLVVDFAREDNKDGKGLVLIARATPKGDSATKESARKVAESLKLKK